MCAMQWTYNIRVTELSLLAKCVDCSKRQNELRHSLTQKNCCNLQKRNSVREETRKCFARIAAFFIGKQQNSTHKKKKKIAVRSFVFFLPNKKRENMRLVLFYFTSQSIQAEKKHYNAMQSCVGTKGSLSFCSSQMCEQQTIHRIAYTAKFREKITSVAK